MEKKVILENKQGAAVRTFRLKQSKGVAVYREDIRRLEVWDNEAVGQSEKIPFTKIKEVTESDLTKGVDLGQFGKLKALDFVETVIEDSSKKEEGKKTWWVSLAVFAVLGFGSIAWFKSLIPQHQEQIQEEIKAQIVQVIKQSELKPKAQVVHNQPTQQEQQQQPKNLTKNVKRLGALAALGSLSNSKQKAGLNLGAANTTAGPGLGGTEGSGGTQTSLYAKGILSAPVGAGGNVQGAGGYGTKGKGGGQAGYGTLSLVGSAGTSTIPLGQEAIVEGGLDRDAIAAVVQRNMGQIRFCYEQGLQLEPALAGRVVASWTINSQGAVIDPGIANTTLKSKTVEDCIMMRLRSWKFPLPQGGVSVKVSYPFMLKRVGS